MPRPTAGPRSAVFLVLLALCASPRHAGSQAAEVKVIVNAANPGRSASRKDITDIFMKRARRWSFGAATEPVDQSLASPVRAAFCREVLKEALPAVQRYWQQQIASGGSTPPPVKAGDDEVIAFVAAAPGGVGYVAAGTALPAGVKVLQVEDEP